jgi:hypothetical protein
MCKFPLRDCRTSEQSVIKRFAALLVLLSIVSVTIVHACSGLDGMPMASLHSSSENPIMRAPPCDHSDPNHSDVCESVRYRLLSIQVESPQNALTILSVPLPETISVEDLLPVAALRAGPPGAVPVDSLSRHSPHFSHIVLRI